MKRVISLFLVVVILIFVFSGCESTTEKDDEISIFSESTADKDNSTESLTKKIVREVEGAYFEEQKKLDNSTTSGMIGLTDKYTEKWKQIADEYYNKIMEYDGIVQPSDDYYSADDLHTFVSNMKTSWEQYNQTQCDNYVKTLQTIYAPGTIVGPIFASYKYELQKDWALQLVGIYEQFNVG